MAENEYKENDEYFDADMGDGFAIKLLSAKDRFALYWDAPKDFMSNLKQIINNEEGDLAEKKLKLGKIKEVESKVGELQGKKVLAKSEEEKKQLDEAIAGFFVSDIDQIAVESAMSVIQRMKGQKEEGQNKWDYIKNTKTDGKRRYGLSDEGVERIENFLFENSANQPAPVNTPQPQPQPQPVPQPQPQPAPVPQPQPQPSPAPNPTPVPNVTMVEEPGFAKDYRLSDDVKDRVDANNKGATLAAIIEAFANAKTPEDAFQAAFIAAILYLPNKLAWGIELATAREKEKNEYIKKEIESYDNLIAGSKGLNDSDRIYSVHKEFFDACGDLCVAAANLKKTHPELLDGLDIQFDANGKVTGDVPDILRERILQRGYFDTYGHMPTVDKLKELQKQSITLQNSGMYAKERSSQPTPVPQPAPTPQPQPNPAPQPQPVPKVQDNVTVNVNGKEMSLKENVDVLLTVKAKDLQLEYADYVTLKTAYQTKAQAIQKNRADLNNAKMGINLTIKDKQFPNQKGFTREAYEV